MAESFPDCLFLDIYGDESSNTRVQPLGLILMHIEEHALPLRLQLQMEVKL